jgi:hypothetical protein
MVGFKVGKPQSQKRERIRDSLWADAKKIIWSRKTEDGYCSVPRTLPLVMTLINLLSPKGSGDASRVYHELWCRAFDEGFVDIVDEEEHAYAAGYVTKGRSVRSWRERMDVLVDLGFIRIKPKGSRKHGSVLLVHPDIAVEALRSASPQRIPEAWYNAYSKRMIEIGAKKAAKRP